MTLQADFASQDYFRNPAAEIEKLRAAGPVVEVRFPIVGRVWTPTTQALAHQVLKDTDTFTIRNEDGTITGFRWWMPGIVRTLARHMLSMDDPDHKRLRDIVDEAFRRRAVMGMEPRIQAIGDELADELFTEGSPADLVERYARELPAIGDLRTAGVAAGRPAEIHCMGRRLYPFYRSARIFPSDPEPAGIEALYRAACRDRPPAGW